MNTLCFSIIITAFNQEKSIEKTINSVLSQNFEDFEVIVVDDCSSDNTLNILKKIQEKNLKLKIIHHEKNESTFMSRLSGIKVAAGNFILFLDGDDFLQENTLRQFQEIIAKEDFEVCEFSYIKGSNNQICYPETIMENSSWLENFAKENMPKTLIWNKIYNAEVLKKSFENIPTAYLNVAEDWYMNICIAKNTKKYIQSKIIAYYYNDAEGITNIKYSFEKNEKNIKSISKVLEFTKEVLSKIENKTLAERIINNFELKLYDWSRVKIQYQTITEDINKSYLLLPKYFPLSLIEKDFALLREDALRFRNGKISIRNILKRIYHTLRRR